MEGRKCNILWIGDEAFFRDSIEGELSEEFSLSMASTEKEAVALIAAQKPDLILLEREIPKEKGEEICRNLKESKYTMNIPVIMVASPKEKGGVIVDFDAGADDYLAKPLYFPELQAKIRSHLRTEKLYSSFRKSDLMDVVEVYETITSFHTSHDILDTITKKLAKATNAARCSVVKIDESTGRACVVASSEDEKIDNLEIDLDKYPEIRNLFDMKRDVFVVDLQRDPVTSGVRDALKGLPFRTVAIMPISLRDKMIGTLLLRVAEKKKKLTERDMNLCMVAARAAYSVLENAKLVESLRVANIELEKLATTDGLTGIYNHRYFYERLDEEYNISVRYNVPLACIMLDLDFFKKINDTYGHREGDHILKEVAVIIDRTIRKTDVAARYGGEEFVILLPHTDERGAMFQAERIRSAVRKGKYSALPKGEFITISLGIATCDHDNICVADDMVKFADKALYEAKRTGRNRSVMWGKF